MITLATLPQATAQEVLNHVTKHLVTQGRKSLVGSQCKYRGENDLQCAAGCLIGDNEYNAEFEGRAWDWLVNNSFVPDAHVDLVCRMQRIHDQNPPAAWPRLLLDVASEFNLEPPPFN